MRLVQVITDYIRRSILTTQGDLVVRGAAQPERLIAGVAGTVLTSQGVGAIPAYEEVSHLYYEPPDGCTLVQGTGQVRNAITAIYTVDIDVNLFITNLMINFSATVGGAGSVVIRNVGGSIIFRVARAALVINTAHCCPLNFNTALQLVTGDYLELASNAADFFTEIAYSGYTRPV